MIRMYLQRFGDNGAKSENSRQRSGPPTQTSDESLNTAAEKGLSAEETIKDLEVLKDTRNKIEAKLKELKKELYEHLGRSKKDKAIRDKLDEEERQLLTKVYQLIVIESNAMNYLKANFPREYQKWEKAQRANIDKQIRTSGKGVGG